MKHKALNVGQGFPNFPPALHVMESLSAIPVENHMNNQYCRGFGHAPLVQALSDFYSPCMGRTIDPQTEFLVTVGAYYALYSVTQCKFQFVIHHLKNSFNSLYQRWR